MKKQIKVRSLLIWGLVFMFFIAGNDARGQIPQTLSYQGVLTDAQGNAVSDGSYSLTFNLYESATGGSSIWDETQNIEVVNGLFNVILGSVKPLSNSFDRTYWLGIAIGNDSELEPRIELTAAAYSLNARSVADSSVTGESIAEGQIVRSLNGVTDEVVLSAGENISLLVDGQNVTISAKGQVAESRNTLDAADGDPTDVVFVDNEGNVGIGTTTPSEQLEIAGNFELPLTSASAGIIKSGGKRFIHNFGSDRNFFAGVDAGNLTMTGTSNTAVGRDALLLNSIGDQNTAVGSFALSSNTSGKQNTAVGFGALLSNTTGSNTAVGRDALLLNTTGGSNTAVGRDALLLNTTGGSNTVVGESALGRNSTGGSNTAVGSNALDFNTEGDFNTAVGRGALDKNKTGEKNTAIGDNADVAADNLTNATAIGANAVVDASDKIRLGDGNVTMVETAGTVSAAAFVGDGSQLTGLSSSPWEINNNVISYNNGNVGIGTTSPDGKLNIGETVGASLLLTREDAATSTDDLLGQILFESTDGGVSSVDAPVMIRAFTSEFHGPQDKGGYLIFATKATDTDENQAATERVRITQNGDVGIGTPNPQAALHIRSVDARIRLEDTFLGNTFQQWDIYTGEPGADLEFENVTAGTTPFIIQASTGNVGIGTSSPSNPLEMGSGAHVTAGGVWTDASSRKYKENIRNLTTEEAITALLGLEPMTYNYKIDQEEEYVGFIAEDVPELVATNDRKSLSPMDIVGVLTKVVQEQRKAISKLQDEVNALKQIIK